MKKLSSAEYDALLLIRQNPHYRDMLPAAHRLLNVNIKALLRGNFVRYADNGRTGYALTTRGYHVTDVPREAKP